MCVVEEDELIQAATTESNIIACKLPQTAVLTLSVQVHSFVVNCFLFNTPENCLVLKLNKQYQMVQA